MRNASDQNAHFPETVLSVKKPEMEDRPAIQAPAFSRPPIQKATTMGMIKNYLLNLLQQCSEEQFGQDVVEWAIFTGRVSLSYNLEADVRTIMARYDELIDAYRLSSEYAERASRTTPAPMKRAVPRRESATIESKASARRKKAM